VCITSQDQLTCSVPIIPTAATSSAPATIANVAPATHDEHSHHDRWHNRTQTTLSDLRSWLRSWGHH
jgi:hypothetical protein